MGSKYDAYWQEQLPAIGDALTRAVDGRPANVALTGLTDLGVRQSWSGTAVVRGTQIVDSAMAHVTSLARIVVDAGLTSSWPSTHIRLGVNRTGDRLTITAELPAQVQRRNAGPVVEPRASKPGSSVDPAEACQEVHQLLSTLPVHTEPAEIPFDDGLYVFYEAGERSGHDGAQRIVRIGNHPKSQGRLGPRLQDHYRSGSGAKNGSVFRRYLGGALLRSDDASSPCLAPGPGQGHWERQNGRACDTCSPVEQRVTDRLRAAFTVRVVRIDDMAMRNEMEARLIATIAACPRCRPSTSWLGRHCYSEKVRQSGLWNSEFVGSATLDRDGLHAFASLVASSQSNQGGADLSAALLLIPCCASKRGRGPLQGRPARSVAEFIDERSAEALERGRTEAFQRPSTSIDKMSGLVPALVRYTGQPYKTTGFRSSLLAAMDRGLHCLVVSGGYGLLRPEELIHDYGAMLQGTRPVWRTRVPMILRDYVQRQRIIRTFGAFSQVYASVIPSDLAAKNWRAIPRVERTEGPIREVPRRVGSALSALLDADFDVDAADDGLTSWRS